jgi:Uma2 family endonuclease
MSATLAPPEVVLGAYPGSFTIDDIFALPEDGMRHELLDGSIIVTPPPTAPHQVAAARLVRMLVDAAPDDSEALENIGVTTLNGMFIPDVAVVPFAVVDSQPKLVRASDVLLAIEIMSPSSRTMDRLVKPACYAEAGLPNYWRVEFDGADAPVVIVHERKGSGCVEVCRVGVGEAREVDQPYPVRIEPAALVGPRRRRPEIADVTPGSPGSG